MYVDFSITFDSVSLVKLSVHRYGFGTGRKNGSSHFSTVVANVFDIMLMVELIALLKKNFFHQLVAILHKKI